MIKDKLKDNGKIEIDLTGPDGNAYYILGVAKNLCKQVGIPFEPLMKLLSPPKKNRDELITKLPFEPLIN